MHASGAELAGRTCRTRVIDVRKLVQLFSRRCDAISVQSATMRPLRSLRVVSVTALILLVFSQLGCSSSRAQRAKYSPARVKAVRAEEVKSFSAAFTLLNTSQEPFHNLMDARVFLVKNPLECKLYFTAKDVPLGQASQPPHPKLTIFLTKGTHILRRFESAPTMI